MVCGGMTKACEKNIYGEKKWTLTEAQLPFILMHLRGVTINDRVFMTGEDFCVRWRNNFRVSIFVFLGGYNYDEKKENPHIFEMDSNGKWSIVANLTVPRMSHAVSKINFSDYLQYC